MPLRVNRRRPILVLGKIDEILAWEQRTETERDTKFVELGRYLCEVRAGQYWRLESLKCFDQCLESPEPRPCRGELRGETCFAQPAGRRVVELGWQVMVVGCLVPLCPLESMTSVAAKNCLVASRPEKGQARPRQW